MGALALNAPATGDPRPATHQNVCPIQKLVLDFPAVFLKS